MLFNQRCERNYYENVIANLPPSSSEPFVIAEFPSEVGICMLSRTRKESAKNGPTRRRLYLKGNNNEYKHQNSNRHTKSNSLLKSELYTFVPAIQYGLCRTSGVIKNRPTYGLMSANAHTFEQLRE